MAILEKLQKKMKTANSSCSEPSEKKCNPSRNAMKTTRKIELGWLHEGKQIRKRSGGGTRVVSVSKDSKKQDLLIMTKDLFFPNDESQFGKWEEFDKDIKDFKETPINDVITVGELYNQHKFGILRFYLSTRFSEDSTHNDTDVENTVSSAESETLQIENNEDLYSEPYDIIDLENLNGENTTETVIFEADDSEVFVGGIGNATSQIVDLDDTLPVLIIQNSDPPATSSPIYTEQLHRVSTELDESDPVFPVFPLGSSFTSSSVLDNPTITLEIHRVNVVSELISHFKSDEIMKFRLKYKFVDEKGSDADGVSRDVYAAFWNEFVDGAAEGADMRVPALTPKWQEEEWQAIGRILARGFIDQDYFPLRLAPAFTTALIFGEHSISTDVLFQSFLLYLSHCDRDLVETALKGPTDTDSKEELLDLLDRLGVTVLPTPDNLKAILLQAAHKVIIQTPKYALDNMAATSMSWLRTKITTEEEMQKMYEDKKPTCKKVLRLIEANPSNPVEQQSLKYLQQYIRELDQVRLRHLLRFITGSDVICVPKIQVMFTLLDGLSRRPVAHTCGAVLELPSTYNSFPELRVEMDGVLNNKQIEGDFCLGSPRRTDHGPSNAEKHPVLCMICRQNPTTAQFFGCGYLIQ
ncbi:hypothetical protein WMY93_000369 [Mugilogobius chulae]|uniref:HECT domain-containing protein n=1 Tax=Mugilogobius chulae TaxID=88201 RepID=A0AAW0PYR1_9GOBI